MQRLYALARQRTRKALHFGRGLALLCLSCGVKTATQSSSSGSGSAAGRQQLPGSGLPDLEPTIACMLGQEGGGGLISSVIDELFQVLQPTATAMSSKQKQLLRQGSSQSRGMNTAAAALAASVEFEKGSSQVRVFAMPAMPAMRAIAVASMVVSGNCISLIFTPAFTLAISVFLAIVGLY